MSKIVTEEKSPLLLMEDKYDDVSKSKKVHFENSRIKEIYSGATTVFTHFPDYTGNCWIVTAFCGLTFFMMMLLLVGTITTTSLRVPRCIPPYEMSNKTVLLVYPFQSESWKPQEYEILDQILKSYEDYKIHIIFIRGEIMRENPIYHLLHPNDDGQESTLKSVSSSASSTAATTSTTSKVGKKKETKRKRRMNDYRLSVDVEARKLLDMILHGKIMDKFLTDKTQTSKKEATTIAAENTTTKSVIDLIKHHPNIFIENTTFNKVFFNSPLYGYWGDMNDDLKVFAVRILYLWQNGGISFDLQPSVHKKGRNDSNDTDVRNCNHFQKILTFVANGKKKYESLPENVVVADDEGLHMMSKIPCHVFFGQILMNLRKSKTETTVNDVIKSSVSVFCKHFAAGRKYCDKLLSG